MNKYNSPIFITKQYRSIDFVECDGSIFQFHNQASNFDVRFKYILYCAETQLLTKHLPKKTIIVTFVYHKQQSIFYAEELDP